MIPLMIVTAAKQAGISAILLFSVCSAETGLKNTVNYNDPNGGSLGYCQIALPTAREQLPYLDMVSLMQPEVNFLVAALYLKKIHNKYRNVRETIAVYNAGNLKFVNDDFCNVKYVDKVMRKFYSMNGVL